MRVGLNNKIARTTRECVHLFTRVHFRSRDKDGSHTVIRYHIVENPMLHANVMAVFFCVTVIAARIKFDIAGIGTFNLFGSCDLDLDPMTFIYELDL